MKLLKKKIIVLFLLFIIQHCASAEIIRMPQAAPTIYNEYIMALLNDKDVIFNALNLSDEQIFKYEEISKEFAPLYKKYLNEINNEISKTNPNSKIIRKNEKEIIRLSQKEDKKLKSFLDKFQCRKYRQIKHLETHDLKKEIHPKNYYKLNPQMKIFGGIKQNCPKD